MPVHELYFILQLALEVEEKKKEDKELCIESEKKEEVSPMYIITTNREAG